MLAFALLALTGCPTITPIAKAPEPLPIHVEGTYEHPASGLQFPESVGGWTRVGITQFDRDGQEIGVGYNREQGDALVALTVYVRRPSVLASGEHASFAREFELEENAIREHHDGASEVSSRDVDVSFSDRSFKGRVAEFHYVEDFAGARRDVISLLYLFERDGWVVKYRITYAELQKDSCERVVAQFLKLVPWGACAADR